MTRALSVLLRRIADALRDMAPIILVIAFFQIVVLYSSRSRTSGASWSAFSA